MKGEYSPVFDYIAGGILLEEDKKSEAEKALLKAVKKEAQFTRAHKTLAMLYLKQEKKSHKKIYLN